MIYFWALDIFQIAIEPAQLVDSHHRRNRLILESFWLRIEIEMINDTY